MFKSDIRLLLVEDDKVLGDTLREVLESDGFQVEWVRTPKEAVQLVQRLSVHGMIVDVMLPQKSGVDLLKELRGIQDEEVPAFLMSGIYKDKNFIKTALQQSKATDFLVKPFKAELLIDFLNQAYEGTFVAELSPKDKILFEDDYSKRDLVVALEQEESIHSLELPIYLSKIVNHHLSGTITLTQGDTQDTSVIEINHGKITGVKVKDPKSVFGQLLVEKGFLTHEELETALAQPGKKRIGEKLIDANFLSPHAIDIVNTEQLAIRLSLLIGDYNYQIQFKETPGVEAKHGLDPRRLGSFLADWLPSKYTTEWMEVFFAKVVDNGFKGSKKLEENNPLLLNPIVAQIPGLVKQLTPQNSIGKLIDDFDWPEESLYQALIYLIANDFLFFDAESREQDLEAQTNRLRKLLDKAKNQDYFGVLGVPRTARGDDVKKAFKDLAKIFHPDKLPSSAPMELKDCTKEYFSILTKAHDVLTTPESKEAYLKELKHGQTKIRLEQEALFEEAKENLHKQKYKEARNLLEKAVDLFQPTPEILLHHLWAKIKTVSRDKAQEDLALIHQELNRIPPEDRHNATYYFVKGLFQKNIGENSQAKNNLQHAIGLEPNFLEAKRELNVIKIGGNDAPVNILEADLKDVMGMLFKKKKR